MTRITPTQRPRITAHGATIAIAIAALVGGVILMIQSPVEAAVSPASSGPPAMPVSVAAVLERKVAHWSEFSGRLEAVGSVEVRSRVQGYIESVHVKPGSLVKKGDTLFVIDPKPFAAEVARAQAAVAAAEARRALADAELARAQSLLDDRAIAQREFDERRHAQREAQAALTGAQAQLEMAKLQLGYTRITAPISGRIGRAEVTEGNLVAGGAGSPVLTTIVSVSPIYASFEADERSYLAHVAAMRTAGRTGTTVQMGLAHETGHPHTGSIESVDNRLDPRSGTVRVRAVFDNQDGTLAPGMFARIRLGGGTPADAVLIADRAVGTDQHKKFVWVVGEGNKVAWREVTLGPAVGDGLRVVESGLAPGERIVVNGVQRVRPGTVVAPTMVGMTERPQPVAQGAGASRS